MRRLFGNKHNVADLHPPSGERLYYVHYDGQFLGTIAARSRPQAYLEAEAKFGSHVVPDRNLLEIVDSGKTAGERGIRK